MKLGRRSCPCCPHSRQRPIHKTSDTSRSHVPHAKAHQKTRVAARASAPAGLSRPADPVAPAAACLADMSPSHTTPLAHRPARHQAPCRPPPHPPPRRLLPALTPSRRSALLSAFLAQVSLCSALPFCTHTTHDTHTHARTLLCAASRPAIAPGDTQGCPRRASFAHTEPRRMIRRLVAHVELDYWAL